MVSEELVKQAVSYAIAETRKIVAEEYEAAMEQMAEEMTRKAADTIEAQAAEIKRLREVLGRIAEETDHDCETMWVTDIVRAALGETE